MGIAVEKVMADEKTEQELEACQEENEDLKAENVELRKSADAFGELAERLNQALYPERVQQGPLAAERTPETATAVCPHCSTAQGAETTHVPPSIADESVRCDHCGQLAHPGSTTES